MSFRSYILGVGVVVAGIGTITVVGGSWYTVDQGDRGVVLRNGEIIRISDPGLGFKFPIIDDVKHISIRDQSEGIKLAMYSADQQPADMDLIYQYKVPATEVKELYEKYGSIDNAVERLIKPVVREKTKNVFGTFRAEVSIKERARLSQEISSAIMANVSGPIDIIGIQVADVNFSDAYEKSIEERMIAEVAVAREMQNVEKEKQLALKVHETAKGEANKVKEAAAAEAKRIKDVADAEAHAIRVRGEAEAYAITQRSRALGENALLIELTQAERWGGQLPTTVLGDAIPFFNVK